MSVLDGDRRDRRDEEGRQRGFYLMPGEVSLNGGGGIALERTLAQSVSPVSGTGVPEPVKHTWGAGKAQVRENGQSSTGEAMTAGGGH